MENWKDINGYEGLYQISDEGRVKNIKFNKYLNPWIEKGYEVVSLRKQHKSKHFRVHRLVAEAFIKTDSYDLDINHIDENKSNNRVNNLEWCTRKYNINYGTRTERMSKSSKGGKRPPFTEEHKIKISQSLKKYYSIKKSSYLS